MSTMPPDPAASPYGSVSPGMVAHLRATGPWVRFLAILGFIGSGLMVVLSLVMMVVGGAAMGKDLGLEGPAAFAVGLAMGAVYLFIAGWYVVFSWLLYRYASAISAMKAAPDVPTFAWAMESALHYQRRFWKVAGIVMIVMLVAYVAVIAVVFVMAVVAGIAGAK